MAVAIVKRRGKRLSVDQLLSLPLANELIVVIISALPIFELRASIPVGILTLGLPWYTVFPLAVVGNLLPVPIILVFLNTILNLLSKVAVLNKLVGWIYRHARHRSKMIERYEHLGLLILVGIPLPFTGAWTGSIVASVLGLKFFPSLVFIASGVVVAGILVLSLTLLRWIGATIAGIAILTLIGISVWHGSRRGEHTS